MDERLVGLGSASVVRVERRKVGPPVLVVAPGGADGPEIVVGPAPGASLGEYCEALSRATEELSLLWMDVRLMIATFGEGA